MYLAYTSWSHKLLCNMAVVAVVAAAAAAAAVVVVVVAVSWEC